MLSISQCRELLGENCPEDDAEVEKLLQQLYRLAEVVVDQSHMLLTQPETLIVELTEEQRATVEERAAILEFDAGMSRRVAERRAFTASFKSRKTNR